MIDSQQLVSFVLKEEELGRTREIQHSRSFPSLLWSYSSRN